MIALLVILTFAVMLVLDHLLLRQPLRIEEAEPGRETARPRPLAGVVAGFAVPDNLSYHPGHTWAVAETPELVRVGLDDFAAKTAGPVERIDTPMRGQWIRQGQRIIAMKRNGRDVALLSPVEGTVVDVNEAAMANPEIVRTDPYGYGWLLKVQAPDLKTNFLNLLNGTLARRWMEEAAAKLRTLTLQPAGATAQEGGVAADDLLRDVTTEEWPKVARELFLTV